jgi:DNA-binding NarL/FixJ family response regulator
MSDITEAAPLSRREWDITRKITEGKCRKIVADELKISIHTIDAHLRHIHIKTNTHSIAELIIWAFRNDTPENY